jgi:hypothetical protein
MTKTIHPADAADLALIAQAIGFNVHRRLGPTEKINIGVATLAEAAVIAAEINRRYPGRAAMVYALLPEGSPTRQVHVPPAMLALR